MVNIGFQGAERLAFCAFPPAIPDHYTIEWEGVGSLNPSDYPCVGQPFAVRGIDLEYADGQKYVCTDTASPSTPAIYTTFASQPYRRLVGTGLRSGIASHVGNSTAMIAGNCDRGAYVAMSGDGSLGNEQGYGLLLKNGGIVQLVQFTEGIAEPYEVLALGTGIWTTDQFTSVQLSCLVDPIQLKGVYLRASCGNFFQEFVYCGGTAYVPTSGPLLCGWGVVAYSSTVVFYA